jgi:hypothetical protein
VRRSGALAAAALAAAASSACLPGTTVEVYNHTSEVIAAATVSNDGTTRPQRIPPGESRSLGRQGVTWYLAAGESWRYELRHPGREFAAHPLFGGEHYRFQVEPGGCVYVLGPDQPAPATGFARQPEGYPLGSPERCGAAAPPRPLPKS